MNTVNEKEAASRGLPKLREGVVVSNSMDKTAVVKIVRQVKHPAYGKYIKRSQKYLAHDKDNQCQIGDVVRIKETRPLSKNKRWKIESFVSKAQ
jgi:small subunit ribosomal protein S17